MTILWDDQYPDQRILQNEIGYRTEAFVEVLLEEIPKSEIEGVYFKGSAQKEWESPLDYVPEISDVDIHILFSNDSSIERYLRSMDKATHIQSKVEERYFSKAPKPVHIPRPQLIILNSLQRDEDYIPSPKSAVTVMYGKDYPEPDYSNVEKIRFSDCKRLISEEEFISRFPLQIVDRPARYLWEALRTLVWHVSPSGPRVIHILGIPTEKAWGSNRTRIVSLLRETGEHQFAEDYARFYLSGWQYFLSKYSDTDAGRSTVISGIRALNKAVEIAKSWWSRHSSS